MKYPKLIGLNLCDNRKLRGYIEFSYFYLHCKANDINYYDCCVANLDALWYALRGTSFVADITLTDGNTYKVLVLCKIRMSAMEGLVVLIDDIDGLINAFKYLDIKHRVSMFNHHEKYIMENYPETWRTLLTLK